MGWPSIISFFLYPAFVRGGLKKCNIRAGGPPVASLFLYLPPKHGCTHPFEKGAYGWAPQLLGIGRRHSNRMAAMPIYPVPHSPEWFAALEKFNSGQAAHSAQIIKRAGRSDVCSICGDSPTLDYKIVGDNLPDKAVATIRLCEDCRAIRERMYRETYEPFRLM